MDRKKGAIEEEGLSPLIINSQSQMVGDLVVSMDVKIDGHVIGNVTTTKSVIIGEKGKLKGNLICNNLRLFGLIEGVTNVKELAYFHGTAVFTGILNANTLSILPGSIINADINLKEKKSVHYTEVKTEMNLKNGNIYTMPDKINGIKVEQAAAEEVKEERITETKEKVENPPAKKSFLLNNLNNS